ncbi:MAG TPA: nucleotide-binding protein, partial [Methanoregulaceae archaeon]|nr:nucleotide-binding protein [Methanoregulaceae archaeon]
MRIGTIDVRISIIAIAVAVVFLILLLIAYLTSGQITLIVWGIPVVILLILIPMGLNYMSQYQYIGLIPEYERMARPVRVKMINESLLNQVVRLEG